MLLINDENFKSYPGIYIIKNLITGKEYIGESLNIRRRMLTHSKTKDDQRIHRSILKYGIENFQVYCEYFPSFTKKDLLELEEKMILDYNTLIPFGYNVAKGRWCDLCDYALRLPKPKGHGEKVSKAKKGVALSESHKKSLSKAHKGKKLSQEHKNKIKKSLLPYKGIPISEEVREKLRYFRKDLTPVIQLDKDGNFIAEYKSIREAERETGARNAKITAVCKGKRKSTNGFLWKYKDSE